MRTTPYAFEPGWVPIGQTRGEPVHIGVPEHQGQGDYGVGYVRFQDGAKFYYAPDQHAKVVRWFKWWFDDMVEH